MRPAFFIAGSVNDPRTLISLPGGENVDFEALLAEAKRLGRCAECWAELDYRVSPRSAFCCPKHRYAFRDRRRYAADPEAARGRARAYYARNREAVLERAAVKRGRLRPVEQGTCSECGEPLPARRRVVCSERCREARFKRLHPEAYAEREARKVSRRRDKRREARRADV